MALIKYKVNYYPWMTSNNAPAPFLAVASQSTWGAFRAFSQPLDDDLNFSNLADDATQYVEITLDTPIKIWAFKIMLRTTVTAQDQGQVPKNFSIQGSVDGTTFTTIGSYVNSSPDLFCKWNKNGDNKYDWSAAEYIEVECAEAYKVFRFVIGDCQTVVHGQVSQSSVGNIKLTRCELYQVEGSPTPTEYSVEVINGVGSGNYLPGVSVSCAADDIPGKRFKNWEAAGVTLTTPQEPTIGFIMPYNNVRLEAIYESIPEPTYTVSVLNGTGSGVYKVGAEVRYAANIIIGKRFIRWNASGVTLVDATISTSSFIMPANNVQLTGVYEDIPEPVYTVSVTNGAGSGLYKVGTVVTIQANVIEGKDFVSWQITGISLDNPAAAQQSFAMPANDVSLVATYVNHGVPVESVHIFFERTTIGVGETTRFSTEVRPENATNSNVTVCAANPTICSVVDDIITGLAAGITTITGTCSNGKQCTKTITVLGPREPNDSDYNAQSREILVKLEIFFDGIDQEPFVVTRSDYLIDSDLLEEASAEAKNPLGAVSSNELSFSLFNENGLFSPTNKSGKYYGKIKTGVPIKPYFRPNTPGVAWTQMGVYYVSDWNASVTGAAASVTANDKLQKVFLEPTPSIPVQLNKTFKQLLMQVFAELGYPATISDALNQNLLYSFIEGAPQKFLQEILEGAIAYCLCNKNGDIVVKPLEAKAEIRATLSDADQIISVEIKQSITKTYNGVELTYSLPQITGQVQLLNVKDVSIPVGLFTHSKVAFSRGPVEQVTNLYALTNNREVMIRDYTSTPWDITFVTQNNTSGSTQSNLVVYGYAIDFIKALLTDTVSNALKAGSRYIQTQVYAARYKAILNAFINNDMPTITLSIRGNPLLDIGDKVRIVSERYNLDFVGILQRVNYKYVGSLSCEITLLNAKILEEVT